jgi:hypothetical protein
MAIDFFYLVIEAFLMEMSSRLNFLRSAQDRNLCNETGRNVLTYGKPKRTVMIE